MRNLSYHLSKRLSGNSQGTGRTGSVIAILGVAFAVAVMELTLAVSVGFKERITEKLEGFISPVTVTAPVPEGSTEYGTLFVPDINVTAPVREVFPEAEVVNSIYLPGMIKTDDDFLAVTLKGYENDYQAVFEKSNMQCGRWLEPEDRRNIVVSSYMADHLGLAVGDKITMCFFIDGKVKARPFTLTGIYDSGFAECDKIMAYTASDDIRSILRAADNEVSAVEIRNVPLDSVPVLGERLRDEYFKRAVDNNAPEMCMNVNTVTQDGAIYLNWLDLLDTNVVVIFILMALVAASTLISSLFIQVLEKVNAIGLLRAIGASDKLVSRIFIHLTLKLVGFGIIAGNAVGLGLIYVQSKWQVISLDPEMYYLKHVPVDLSALTIILLNISVVIAAWLILIVPARIATRLSPASTLRFE